jgi:hypothetical protein
LARRRPDPQGRHTADPLVFRTATPQWHEADTFMSRPGRTFRILAINGQLVCERARITG